MKRFSFIAMTFCLAVFNSTVFASEVSPEGPAQGTIAVSATQTDEFQPDIVTLNIAVEVAMRKAGDAGLEAAKKAEAVISEMKKVIDKDDSIKTGSYNIYPVYEYDNMRKRDYVAGYRAINQITVRSKRIRQTGEMIDSALKAGATNIGGVQFSIGDYSRHCDTVLEKASKRAEAMASATARNFGLKTTGVKHISPVCSLEGERGPLYAEDMRALKQAEAMTPVQPGGVRVSGTVNAEFYVRGE